jgi:hypothetical protein
LAVNHRTLEEPHYAHFRELLVSRGYRQAESQPFIFYRAVPVAQGRLIQVEVDLLAGEYEGTGPRHRTQKFDDVLARKARGADLAFESFTEVELQGELPEGGKDQAQIRVASMVPFLVMKGMALADRMKEKDAWDIYFCIQHYPGAEASRRWPRPSNPIWRMVWCVKAWTRLPRNSPRPNMLVPNLWPTLKRRLIRRNGRV